MRLFNVRVLGRDGLLAPSTVDLPVIDSMDCDASGLVLSPGWLDLHAHLRDPGFLEKETLESGAASASAGGFTHVIAMANTDPVTDDSTRLTELIARAARLPVRVDFVAAVTEGLAGRTLTDAAALHAAGAVALSDDGRHALDRATLSRALAAATDAGLPIFVHAQIESLGKAPEAEARAVAEAIEALSDVPGARLHVQHVSTRAAVDQIRAGKRSGLQVTAEVTPHHLSLTAADARAMGPAGNVNPPLRAADDRDAVRRGLDEGVIDAIATDHAPHDAASKAAGANGYHGFETALGALLGLELSWSVLHRACVRQPREIAGIPADDSWVLIDPDREWRVDATAFRSRGKNTPFDGRWLRGRVLMTICRGRVAFEREAQRV
jgi:dihydroorotase